MLKEMILNSSQLMGIMTGGECDDRSGLDEVNSANEN